MFWEKNVIIHVHLEKAAGSSLNVGLKSICGAERFHEVVRNRRPSEMTPEELSRVGVLSGHFLYGAWDSFFDRNHINIASVREPFERFRSFYHFVKAAPAHPGNAIMGDRSFNEVVQYYIEEQRGAAVNYSLRHLGGRKNRSVEKCKTVLETKYAAVVPPWKVMDLINKMRAQFDLEPIVETITANTGKKYEKDDSMKAYFMEHNAADYEIYQYVLDNHERWLETFDERFKR